LAALASITAGGAAHASDHLDTPTVIADPRADIGDVYAWMSPDSRQANLVMTIVGHTFSDKSPNYDAVNVYRSLLADASNNSVDDGVHRDERVHSATVFPFLAAPDAQAYPGNEQNGTAYK
jgi:hypothetical protein